MNLTPPLHIRNAPTKRMKEPGYHQGDQYAHDFTDGVAGQQHLPDKLRGKVFRLCHAGRLVVTCFQGFLPPS